MHLKLLRSLRKQDIRAGSDLCLTPPSLHHFEQWLEVRSKSQQFLQPWEPEWPEDDLSLIGYKRRLRSYHQQRHSGWGRTYFLFNEKSDTLLGGMSLTRITHGVSKSATLGYWMGVDYANHGYMQKAVPALMDFAFHSLGLRRIEAACVPSNARSMHLLRKCGFTAEGFARDYLEINGKLEDHALFAALKADTNH